MSQDSGSSEFLPITQLMFIHSSYKNARAHKEWTREHIYTRNFSCNISVFQQHQPSPNPMFHIHTSYILYFVLAHAYAWLVIYVRCNLPCYLVLIFCLLNVKLLLNPIQNVSCLNIDTICNHFQFFVKVYYLYRENYIHYENPFYDGLIWHKHSGSADIYHRT